MIYIPGLFLFVHIPRTSGNALTRAMFLATPEPDPHVNWIMATYCSSALWWRHSQASLLRPTMPEWESEDFRKITIIRNPWRIIESTWGYLQRRGEVQDRTFSAWLVEHFQYLQEGFFAHWCCDWETGAPLGVTVYRFEDLATAWREIGAAVGLELVPRDKINQGAAVECDWTPAAIDFVRQRCRGDFARFAYPDHPF